MRHALRPALLLLVLASPALAEPVLTCTADGCAWVEEADPARGVSLYREHPSNRSIPPELWLPAPRPVSEPLAARVEPDPGVTVVYLRGPRHRHGDSAWKRACRAHGVYPSACLPTARRSRRHVAPLAARPAAASAWPAGIPADFRIRPRP